ncbi:MAG: hypothetical protein KGJ07_02920 [Patescibacteria group bacterium]|nr:hypothetical protein [Patescibacteria group bacterium]MDE2590730.1 hypothetical protein [Patescibacteria group bacterium]
MPDGMTGLSLSEMGVAVKKAGNAVKKAGAGALQQAAQQVTGQPPNQIPTTTPGSVFETDDSGSPLGFFQTTVKQVAGGQSSPTQQQQQQQQNQNKPEPTYYTDDGGNPVDLLGGTVKQIQAVGDTQKKQPAQQAQQQGTFVMPKVSGTTYPDETAQQQSGSFDLSSQRFEQHFLDGQGFNQQASQHNMVLEQELAKQKAEDQQKIEQLRKQLHQMYYQELVRKAEGKDQKKEETVQEKLDREKQEEEEKKAKEREEKKKKEEVPMAVKGRQGAHEGLRKQG